MSETPHPLIVELGREKIPSHIAIIMDGNGRWAKSRFMPRVEGHRQGAKTVRMVVEECRKLGVRYLTLYTFSTENWKRPKDEVGALMKLLQHNLHGETALLKEKGIRLRSIGDRGLLSPSVRAALEESEEATAQETGMDLILALSYGGREELVSMTQALCEKVARGELSPAQITHEAIRAHLYAPDVPDPELLIRTSNENRISNFLLWQLAYTEIVLSEKFWPAFSKEDFYAAIREFGRRNRRFGLTGEQVTSSGSGETSVGTTTASSKSLV